MGKFNYKKWKSKYLLKEQANTVTYLGCSMCSADNPYYAGMQVCTPTIPFTLNTDDIVNNDDGFTDPFVLNFDEYLPGFESIGYYHDYMFQNVDIVGTPSIGCIGGGDGYNPYGCTDPNAYNYDPNAEIDDGSCDSQLPDEPCPPLEIIAQPDFISENPTTFNWTGGCPNLPIYATFSGAGAGQINVNWEAGGQYIPNTGEFTWNLPCEELTVGMEYFYYIAQVVDENVAYGSDNIYNMNGDEQGGYGFYLYSNNTLGTIYIDPILCPDQSGCTDENAENYNPEATYDDGSCEYRPVVGCTDETAINYDEGAVEDDGSCVYPEPGCTDENAINYNPEAGIDDGSCEYEGCTDENATNYDETANVDDGSCVYPVPGCTEEGACNYDENAEVNDGSCEYESCAGCMDNSTYFNIETQQEELIAVNYDPEATLPGPCQGCADQQSDNASFISVSQNFAVGSGNANQLYIDVLPEGWNTTELWTNFDYGCLDCCVYSGCSDPEADNFWPMADPNNQPTTYGATWTFIDDGSCEYTIPGCTDPQAGNYNPDATVDDGTCNYFTTGDPIEGCTDESADNYNEEATQDDGSCEYTVFTCETLTSGTPAQIISEECTESISSEPADGETTFTTLESCQDITGCVKPEDEYGGCTDITATNYDSNASYDDGSCEYPEDPCTQFNTYDEEGQAQACYMTFEAPVYDPSTGTGFGQEVIDFFNDLTNNGECCPEQPEPEPRYTCLPTVGSDTQYCVEDPNGAFTSESECNESCPEINCVVHLDTIIWPGTGFNNAEEFCGRCEVGGYEAAEMQISTSTGQMANCGCCEEVDNTNYATDMITGCDGFNSIGFPQSFRDLICEQCEDPNYVNIHCECCEEGVNYNIDAVTDNPDPGTPSFPIRPTPDPEINRMQKLAGLKNKKRK